MINDEFDISELCEYVIPDIFTDTDLEKIREKLEENKDYVYNLYQGIKDYDFLPIMR